MTVSVLTAAMLIASGPIVAPINAGDAVAANNSMGRAIPVFLIVPVGTPLVGEQGTGNQAATPAGKAPSSPNKASSQKTSTDEHDVIVVQARGRPPAGDPLQAVNAKSFAIMQSVDTAVIRPVAKAYQRIIPDPIRSGVRNFLNNLREPVVFLNYMLQLKPGKAAETVGRFAVNTTVGAAGLFDVARKKPFNLPRRRNGLANTLGYYGVKSGPFLFLPIFGPTTVRDLLGDNIDRLVLPAIAGKPFNKPVYAISVGVFSSLDQRAEFDEKLEELHTGSADPYATTREDYLRSRQAAIDALHSQKWRDRKRAMGPPPVVPTIRPENGAISVPAVQNRTP